jgi:hypothetical protein
MDIAGGGVLGTEEVRHRALPQRPVDDDPEGAVLVVSQHQDHRMVEPRVAHRRGRNQELAGKGGAGRRLRRLRVAGRRQSRP